MFGDRIVVRRFNGDSKFSATEGVYAIARALNLYLTTDSCGDILVARLSAPKPFSAVVYKDGKPEQETCVVVDRGFDRIGTSRGRVASFSVEQAVTALLEAMGAEFHAEYVVGSSEPVLRAVKKPAKKTEAV